MSQRCKPGFPLGPRANSLISVRWPVVNPDNTISYYFPNPFQFLGFANTGSFGSPTSFDAWTFDTAANQATNYPAVLAPLFIAFMYANRQTDGGDPAPYPGVTYEQIDAWGKFLGYFQNYMSGGLPNKFQAANKSLINTNYYTFVEAVNEIAQFWNNESAAGPPVPEAFLPNMDVKRLVNFLFSSATDKRFWGAPGKYTISTVAPPPPIPLTIVNTNDQVVCNNGNKISFTLPTPPIGDVTQSFINFGHDAAFAAPNPVPPSATPSLTGNPSSFSLPDVMAWIIAEYAAAGFGTLDSPINPITQSGIEIQANKIVLQSSAGIDGCPNAPINPAALGEIIWAAIGFTLDNTPPWLDALQSYFDANGHYPYIVTAEYMTPD